MHIICFTGKYTIRKIHTDIHPGLEWHIFHIFTSEDIDDFTDIKFVSLKLYLNSLVYDRNIFGSSSKVFGNLPKFSENVRESSSGPLKIFGNRQKRRISMSLNKKNITH